MTGASDRERAPRTVLEQEIWRRRQTLEEFADFAEKFAREHDEPGTLSVRHLKRLVAGHGVGGKPLGNPRHVTTRLLERIFGTTIRELLSPPTEAVDGDTSEERLRGMLRVSARIDGTVLTLLREQLSATRQLDRQLGAAIAYDEVLAKTGQVTRLLGHSLTSTNRQHLAALLAELCTLAGWQALDMGDLATSWQHYERAKTAAKESGDPGRQAHTAAEQAFVLLDLGDTKPAVDILGTIRTRTNRNGNALLRAWLAAAHGEALAADGQQSASLHAFEDAAALLPEEPVSAGSPYVVLDAVHLARWRGHALARIGRTGRRRCVVVSIDATRPNFHPR